MLDNPRKTGMVGRYGVVMAGYHNIGIHILSVARLLYQPPESWGGGGYRHTNDPVTIV